MFDIKKFLAENTVTLNEDDEFKKAVLVLTHAKKKANETWHRYMSRVGVVEKRHLSAAMQEYEAAAKAIEEYWKRQKGKNYNVGRGR